MKQLIFFCGLALFFWGCSKNGGSDVMARVGSRKLTAKELSGIAGKSLDSIPATERWKIAEEWAEQTLIELEGKKRGLDKDEQIQAGLRELTKALYRARILSEINTAIPSDSAIEAYFKIHREEFVRAEDAYLVEMYWAEQAKELLKFCQQNQTTDSIYLDLWPEIASEGRWLAKSSELDKDIELQLSVMPRREFTTPKPYEDGFRVLRLIEAYRSGEKMSLVAVKDEIAQRLIVEQGRKRQDELMNQLKQKYQVSISVGDSSVKKG